MKRWLLVLALSAFVATPAMAELFFSFDYSALTTEFNAVAGVFTADGTSNASGGTRTTGVVTRHVPPPSGPAIIIFDTVGSEVFNITMDIDNILGGGTEADGINGTLLMTDVLDNDITAGLSGHWTINNTDHALHFEGILTNVLFTPANAGDTDFQGDLGVVSMLVDGTTGPWPGVIIELNAPNLLFDADGWNPTVGAGATAFVTPVPAAFVLGLLGLGAAGLGLRRKVS